LIVYGICIHGTPSWADTLISRFMINKSNVSSEVTAIMNYISGTWDLKINICKIYHEIISTHNIQQF